MSQQEDSYYGYVPTRWICNIFVVLFSITTVLHFGEVFYFRPRLYWLMPTIVICGSGEILGWSGRLWSSIDPTNYTAFMVQLVTTIISPTFLTAALYTALGGLIRVSGVQYSRLSAKAYILIFVPADVLALIVQAAGGAIAAGANNRMQRDLGSHVMVAGIFLQMAGITVYAVLLMEFVVRFYSQKPVSQGASPPFPFDNDDNNLAEKRSPDVDGILKGRGVIPRRTEKVVIGIVISTILVFIRSVYRTIELLGGWDGRIITTQSYFNLLDATPIVLAMFVLNVLHPGLLH